MEPAHIAGIVKFGEQLANGGSGLYSTIRVTSSYLIANLRPCALAEGNMILRQFRRKVL